MGLFSSFLNSNGSGTAHKHPGVAKVEECCRQLGWPPDERIGDNGFRLDFKDSIVPVRHVLVMVDETIALFSAQSLAAFYPRDLPAEFGFYLLHRNKDAAWANWQLRQTGDDKVGFMVTYDVPLAGLSPVFFKVVCEGLAKEAREVDVGLRSKGLV